MILILLWLATFGVYFLLKSNFLVYVMMFLCLMFSIIFFETYFYYIICLSLLTLSGLCFYVAFKKMKENKHEENENNK